MQNQRDLAEQSSILLVTTDDTSSTQLASALPPEGRCLVVSYGTATGEILDSLEEQLRPVEIVVVETCQTNDAIVGDDVGVRSESPADLTGIGLQANEIMTRWRNCPEPIVVYFDSVTGLLEHVSVEDAFSFFHMLVGRIRRANAIGCFRLDPDAHDESTVATFQHLFDTALEYDSSSETFRVRGQ